MACDSLDAIFKYFKKFTKFTNIQLMNTSYLHQFQYIDFSSNNKLNH